MMSAERRNIRRALRQQRRRLHAEFVVAAGLAVYRQVIALPAYARAIALVAYVAAENEVPSAAIVDHAVAGGKRVYLPTQTGGGGFAEWRPGEPLEYGPGDVLQPTAQPSALSAPAIVLVPVVGWSQDGTRLGRGGVFYDRVLAGRSAAAVRVGLAYEFQRVDRLAREAWDVPLDYVITEQRVTACIARRDQMWLQKGGAEIR